MTRINSFLGLSDLSFLFWPTSFSKCLSKDKRRLGSRFCPIFLTRIRCSITLIIRIEFLGVHSSKISSTIIWLWKLSGLLKWEQRTPSPSYHRSFSEKVWFLTTSNQTLIGSAKSTNKSYSKSSKLPRDSLSSNLWTNRLVCRSKFSN